MNTQKLFLLIGLLLIISSISPAQEITFQKTIGGVRSDYGYAIYNTVDGGYITVGRTSSFNQSDDDVYLTKTDSGGNLIWTKALGGANTDIGYDIQQTADEGYIITGITTSFGLATANVYLIKTNSNGDPDWSKAFSGGYGQSVRETADSGYIIAGYNYNPPNSDDITLIRTDLHGDTLWTKNIGGTETDRAQSVRQTQDGGYIITGQTASFGAAYNEIFLIKTNIAGNIIWSKTYGGSDNDYARDVQQTFDGGYVITGYTWSFGFGSGDVYVVKTDSSGDLLWANAYGGAGYDLGNSITQTSDGGYIVTGTTDSYGAGNEDVYLIKIDSNGSLLWSKTYGGSNSEEGYSVHQTSDSGYTITGNISSAGSGGEDVYLVKTDKDGNSGCSESNPSTITTTTVTQVTTSNFGFFSGRIVTTLNTIVRSGGELTTLCSTVSVEDNNLEPLKEFLLYQNYPNPFNPSTTITFSIPNEEFVSLKVFNSLGEEVAELINETKPAGNYSVAFDASKLSSGIYFYTINAGNFVETKKMILLR